MGLIRETMRYTTLGELVDKNRGISYGVVQPGPYISNGVPIIRVSDFSNNALALDGVLRIDEEIAHKYRRTELHGGEILISLVGTVGKCIIAPEKVKGWNVARAVGIVPLKAGVNARWVLYSLKSPMAQTYIQDRLNTTVQATFNLRDLASLPLMYPEEGVQTNIVDTLSCLDDKIELNNKINANLEAQAQAIFRSWFVDFEPFQDGEFVDSELGRIPKGWRVVPLSEICYYVTEKVPVSSSSAEAYISTDNMLPGKKGITMGSTLPSATNMTRYQPQDVLISNIRPYFKKIWYSNNSGGCSNDVLVFRAKQPLHSVFLYQLLHTDHFFDYVTSTSKGTKMPRGDKSATMQYQVRFPIKSTELTVHEKFNDLIEPMLNIIDRNFTENSQLIKLRNTLLPKLMSGEIEV